MNRIAKLVTLINLVLFVGLVLAALELLYQGWPEIIIQQGQQSLRYEAQVSAYLSTLHRRIEEQDQRIRELDEKLVEIQDRMARSAAARAEVREKEVTVPVFAVP